LVTYWNYSSKSGDLKKISSKSGEFQSFFSMKNPLYRGSHISKFGKSAPASSHINPLKKVSKGDGGSST
jgi:hypothetical protein